MPSPVKHAVLVSGGLDSAVMVAEVARSGAETIPIYVRSRLGWEGEELARLTRFLAAIAAPNLRPLVILECPVTDLYGNHWSIRGEIPDAVAPDESFYLPGRNVILLAKPLLWCCLNQVPQLSLGVLGSNPFPDATPEFFRDFARTVGSAVGKTVTVQTPYAELTKSEVVARGREFPLEHSLSCMSPRQGRHCGECGKCAERGRAFLEAGVPDRTDYVSEAWRSGVQQQAVSRPWE